MSSSGRTMIVLGSGGHTKEMVALLPHIAGKHRVFVVASSDAMSCKKVLEQPDDLFVKIPRAREVRQSWLTSVVTTMFALAYAVAMVFWLKPTQLLCNGPGTCVPLCIAAYIFNVLGWQQCRIIYIESICRVDTLSLSARILRPLPFAEILVQWPQLQAQYPDTLYLGRLS
ncbi:UDP-N-acetylglucosamine transferase subunit ALG14 homolog [Sycon ciliatum]|uniref:UDP-N-acetylglucosamine transferase subunit ALG14 homolog n=1 Tax=Sycon ciliatum TaxID=27933 RepID=UPI0031F6A456